MPVQWETVSKRGHDGERERRKTVQRRLTKDDKGLFGWVWLNLVLWVPALPDIVANIGNGAKKRQVCQAPCPPQGFPDLASFLGRRRDGGSGSIGELAAELEGGRLYSAVESRSIGCRGEGAH